MSQPAEEPYPVDPNVRVLAGINIYKTAGWWKAVLSTETFGKRSIDVYLWQWRFDRQAGKEKWKRKQKLGIRNAEEWGRIKEAVERLLAEPQR